MPGKTLELLNCFLNNGTSNIGAVFFDVGLLESATPALTSGKKQWTNRQLVLRSVSRSESYNKRNETFGIKMFIFMVTQ